MNGMCLDLICQKYYNTIYRYCLAKASGDTSRAERITSDTFYLLIQKWDSYADHPESAVVTWLYKTAKLKWMEEAHRKEPVTLTDTDASIEPDFLDYEEELLRYEKYLADIQNELKPEEAQLFGWRVVEKKSFDDLAKALNISVHAARLRWYRLQRNLLAYLRKHNYI